MTDKTCSTCKYWNDRDDQSCDRILYEYWDERSHRTVDPDIVASVAIYGDSYGVQAVFITTPTFGCNQYESKQK
jgi:hypothetical protein